MANWILDVGADETITMDLRYVSEISCWRRHL
jgi:hypothetical protein